MTARRLLTKERGGSDPTAKEIGKCAADKIYRVVTDMFLFWRKNSRIVAFEEIGYVLVYGEPNTHRDIDLTSLKWKARNTQREIGMKDLPHALTKYSRNVENC